MLLKTNFKFCNVSECIGKLFRKFHRQIAYIFLQCIVVCFECRILPSDDLNRHLPVDVALAF